jgi:mgtE-like transporter
VRGLDPDVITYPVTSTLGDVLITFFYILVSILVLNFDVIWLGYLLSAILFLSPFIILSINYDLDIVVQQLRESILSVFITSIIIAFTGYFFRSMESILSNMPLIYFIYPALLTAVGDSGGIIGSISTTRMALTGEIDVKRLFGIYLPILNLLLFIVFIVYSSFGSFILFGSIYVNIVFTIILGGILSLNVIAVISILISYVTYYRGLDPDNFVIPIESSLADNITTLILFILTIFLI